MATTPEQIREKIDKGLHTSDDIMDIMEQLTRLAKGNLRDPAVPDLMKRLRRVRHTASSGLQEMRALSEESCGGEVDPAEIEVLEAIVKQLDGVVQSFDAIFESAWNGSDLS